MALSEFEIKRCERELRKFLEKHRPPAQLRNQLDYGFQIHNQSIEILEIRPRWDKPAEMMERSFAKTTFVRTKGRWKIYWKRADLNWHSYEPCPEVKSIEEFVSVVDEDKYGCFFG